MNIDTETSFMAREDVIDQIIEYKLECLYLDPIVRDELIEGIFRHGMTGIDQLTDAQLTGMFNEMFEEKVIISDE